MSRWAVEMAEALRGNGNIGRLRGSRRQLAVCNRQHRQPADH